MKSLPSFRPFVPAAALRILAVSLSLPCWIHAQYVDSSGDTAAQKTTQRGISYEPSPSYDVAPEESLEETQDPFAGYPEAIEVTHVGVSETTVTIEFEAPFAFTPWVALSAAPLSLELTQLPATWYQDATYHWPLPETKTGVIQETKEHEVTFAKRHTVTFTHLSPSTTYYYTIMSSNTNLWPVQEVSFETEASVPKLMWVVVNLDTDAQNTFLGSPTITIQPGDRYAVVLIANDPQGIYSLEYTPYWSYTVQHLFPTRENLDYAFSSSVTATKDVLEPNAEGQYPTQHHFVYGFEASFDVPAGTILSGGRIVLHGKAVNELGATAEQHLTFLVKW